MSSTGIIITFAVSIVIMIFLIAKFKVNAVISLRICTLGRAIGRVTPMGGFVDP